MTNARTARPQVIAAMLALTLGFVVLATVSLHDLSADRADPAPIIAIGADELAEALAAAPATSALRGPPEVWIVTQAECGDCRAVAERELAALAGLRVGARLITAPAATPTGALEAGAGPAVNRAAACRIAAACAEPGRAADTALARIAATMTANDLDFHPPVVFWRRGPEWRAAIGDDRRALQQMRRDVALAATS